MGETVHLAPIPCAGDLTEVYALVMRVFDSHVAPDYDPEGVATFRDSVTLDYLSTLENRNGFMLGAWSERRLVGMIAVRDGGHITLFFVEAEHQGKGIGRRLQEGAEARMAQNGVERITVHSSPIAVAHYRSLGFIPKGSEQCEKGIRHLPMEKSCPAAVSRGIQTTQEEQS